MLDYYVVATDTLHGVYIIAMFMNEHDAIEYIDNFYLPEGSMYDLTLVER